MILSSLCILLFQFLLPSVAFTQQDWLEVQPGLRTRPLQVAVARDDAAETRFVSLSPEQSGIDFVAPLDWNHPRGQLFYTGYACGGIAVGDVDDNGLPDLFFASGPNRNRLYLQQSPWRFVESAQASGLFSGEDVWSNGATLLDIDNDGDLDLYVCNYDAANQLYVNRGDGTFDERAAEYGLDIVDASLIASVADYDRDGDLDIYLAMNRYLDEKQFHRRDLFFWRDGREYLRPEAEKYFTIRRLRDQPGQLNMWAGRTDRLLRNEGAAKKFVDVSDAMGLERGDTLSATWCDYNHDGWPDLYVANDMAAPDRLFRNLGEGRFEDVTLQSLPHTPWFAMGSSAGDMDNDGLVDLLVADMSFRTHFKDKATMGDMTGKFRNVSVFPHVQLMRNALFINSGTEHFQEAAYLAGIASTDWTWTAKLADFDNDGRLDAFFTNGTPVNLAAVSSSEFEDPRGAGIDTSRLRERYGSQPPVLEQNLVFQNQGNLQFLDRSRAWGLDQVGMSFAAVHADLDRDGDLDLVVANLDAPPSVYRNDSKQPGILVELRGTKSNRFGLGAEVRLETTAGAQIRQNYPLAGFQSCQESSLHFGLKQGQSIKRLSVRWPSGAEQTFEELGAGQRFLLEEPADIPWVAYPEDGTNPLFEPLDEVIRAEHHEEPFDDFARQPLLPSRLSQLGPPMAWGDVDHDGDLDLFLGEGAQWWGMLYLNQGDLRFEPSKTFALMRDELYEDSAAEFFDANGDGNLDLYVGNGSIEYDRDSELYRDRLYFGDGRGGFVRAEEGWLPNLRLSTGALAASDFDQDGDIDLFVGARSVPGEYPRAPEHALLRNDGEMLVNVLELVARDLAGAGMVTDAQWTDIDGDGWDDLLVATDWGPIRCYRNDRGKLVESTATAGLDQWTGWWQSLEAADLDDDGDMDLIAGNFGLNTKYHASTLQPALLYYGEYGESGRKNLIEAGYEQGTLFPLRGKSCSSAAMPHLIRQFPTYELFAKATLPEIYTPECLQQAQRFEANTLESACFLNDGRGRFEIQPLPRAAQLAPVLDLAIADLNGDQVPDLFLGQNFFGPQRETGPMNGGLSVVALGRGDGTFRPLRADEAGVVVPEAAQAVAAIDLDGDGRHELVAATNNGPVRVFRHHAADPGDSTTAHSAELTDQIEQSRKTLRIFASRQHAIDQALPFARRLLKLDPTNVEALLVVAKIRRTEGRFIDAQRCLEKLRKQEAEGNVNLLVERGRLFSDMGDYQQAAATLLEALKVDAEYLDAHHALAEVRVHQGRLQEARQALIRAKAFASLVEVEQQAKVAQLHFEQGLQAEAAGDEAAAMRAYEKSLRLDSQPAVRDKLVRLLRSSNNEQLRDSLQAEELTR